MKHKFQSILSCLCLVLILVLIAVPTTRSVIVKRSRTTQVSGEVTKVRPVKSEKLGQRKASTTEQISLKARSSRKEIKVCLTNCPTDFTSVLNPKDVVVGNKLAIDVVRKGSKELRGLYVENQSPTIKSGSIIKIYKPTTVKGKRTRLLLFKEDIGRKKTRVIQIQVCLSGCSANQGGTKFVAKELVPKKKLQVLGKITRGDLFLATEIGVRISSTPTPTPTVAPTATPVPTSTTCEFLGRTLNSGSNISAYQAALVPFGQQCVSESRVCNQGVLSGTFAFDACSVAVSRSCTFNAQTVANGAAVTAYQSSTVQAGQNCLSESRLCSDGVLSGSYNFSTCSVNGPEACLFNGQTVAHGSVVNAYQNSTVPEEQECLAESRECTNGVLSGTYNFSSCSIINQRACSFDGRSIGHGAVVTAYQSATVSEGQSCISESRICNDSILSGSYNFASCSVSNPSCLFNGQTIANNTTVTAFLSPRVPVGQTCSAESRICNNGTLSGSYNFVSCTVDAPEQCLFNGQTIANGANVTAYQSSAVPTGQSCVSQERQCNSGTLSGTYQYASCIVQVPRSCLFNGFTISHGQSVLAFPTATVPASSSCVSETRVCQDGTLSGSYDFLSCTVSTEQLAPTLSPSSEIIFQPTDTGVITTVLHDQARQIAYVGTSSSPAQIMRINLATNTVEERLQLLSAEEYVTTGAIDSKGENAYFALKNPNNSSPGKIIKIALSQSAPYLSRAPGSISTFTRYFRTAIIDRADKYAYFAAQAGSEARITRIDLSASTFGVNTNITQHTQQSSSYDVSSAIIDPTNSFLYFGTNTKPGRVLKYDIQYDAVNQRQKFALLDTLTMSFDKLRPEGELGKFENYLNFVAFDASTMHAYFVQPNPAENKIIKVDLATFTRIEAKPFSVGMWSQTGTAYDAIRRKLYVVTSAGEALGSWVTLVDLADFSFDAPIIKIANSSASLPIIDSTNNKLFLPSSSGSTLKLLGYSLETNAPTNVAITSPIQNARITGNITITASASDTVNVGRVQFLIDNNKIGEDDTAPYSFVWHTNAAQNGLRQLKVRAIDTSGNSTESSVVEVNVKNIFKLAFPVTDNLAAVTYGEGIFVASGANSTVLSTTLSDSNLTWHKRAFSPEGVNLKDLTYGNRVFLAGNGKEVFGTPDVLTWTTLGDLNLGDTDPDIGDVQALAYSPWNAGSFVAAYQGPNIWWAAKELTPWTSAYGSNAALDENEFITAYGVNRFALVGKSGLVHVSQDAGKYWTEVRRFVVDPPEEETPTITAAASPTHDNLFGIAYGADKLVAVGEKGLITYANEGKIANYTRSAANPLWTTASSGVTTTLRAITFTGSEFIAVGDAGVILISTNGVTWRSVFSPTTENLFSISYANNGAAEGTIAIVGERGTVITSGPVS